MLKRCYGCARISFASVIRLVVIPAALALTAAAVAQNLSTGPGDSTPPDRAGDTPFGGDIQGEVVEAFGFEDTSVPPPPKPGPMLPSQRLGLSLGLVPEIELEAVDTPGLLAEDAADAETGSKVLRYGVGRELFADLSNGHWMGIVGEGDLWILDVVATEAVGIRLHFAEVDLPPGAEIYVYDPADLGRILGPYEGRGMLDNGEFWTPTIFSDRVRIEYFVPELKPGFQLPDPQFILDRIQHIYRNPAIVDVDPLRGAGSCHNDVTCYSAWATVAKSVAGVGTVNSNSLYCTGQMMATTSNDQTPYWLTARHCISTSSQASSAEIYWLYQTSTCNGSPPALSGVPQSAPCTLLKAGSASDYCLLMVEGAIPSGLAWTGWTSASVTNGTASTCIHHPSGDYKRISFGTKASNTTCGGSNHVRINWTDGPTEPGSSGSGIFRNDTKQLFGQLHCGSSVCGSETNDDYGAFSSTYPNISSYLSAGSDDAQEQNDTCAAAKTMTAGTYSGLIVKSTDQDWYKVSVASGAQLSVSLSFTNANGDVDMKLYSVCGGAAVASSTNHTNSESIVYTNSGATAFFYLNVYLYSDTRNSYNMTITLPGGGGGSNDACASATNIGNGTFTGSTASATNDGSASCGSSSTTKDVWYRYTATCTGTLRVDACGSGYDTVVSLHSACPGTSGNQLVCNDDCSGSPCGGLQSCLSRSVTSGSVVLIRVSGYNGASGSFTLHTSCGP